MAKSFIKMYRHTFEQIEYIGDGDFVITYDQTDWSSIRNYIPPKNKNTVLVEEKVIEIDPEKFDKKKVKND